MINGRWLALPPGVKLKSPAGIASSGSAFASCIEPFET
jgi:hypothetical protein